MAKEVKIVIKAYNQTKAALTSVSAGLKSIFKGDFGKGFGQIGAGFAQFGKTVSMVSAKAMAGLKAIGTAAMAAGVAVVAVGKKALAAYKESAQATAKLEQALTNTSYAAGFTASELGDMATELQKLTGVQDEATMGVMTFLAASGKIRGDNFKRATVAALDMGAAMRSAGDDSAGVEEKAQLLAKALEDPADGLSKLTRIGVQFTKSQEEQIKAMAEAGNIAGAQAAILAEVESRYKGTAAAMHQNTKAQDDLRVNFGELMEQTGKAISESQGFKDTIQSLADVIKDLTESGKIDVWAENVSTAMSAIASAVQPVLKAFGFIGSLVEKSAAFAGGFVGTQGGLYERLKGGTEMAVTTEERNAEELADRAKKKADDKAAKAAADKAKQEQAKVSLAAKDAEEAEAEARRKSIEETDKKIAKLHEEADALFEITERYDELKDSIAKAEQEANENQVKERWTNELEKAREQAEKLSDELNRREEMGPIGSRMLRDNLRKEEKEKREIIKLNQQRRELGMGDLPAEELKGRGAKEEQRRFLRMYRALGETGAQGMRGKSSEEIIKDLEKKGRKLSDSDKELLRRRDEKDLLAKLRAAEKEAEANLKEAEKDKAKSEKEWRDKQEKLWKDEISMLDSLLRAAP